MKYTYLYQNKSNQNCSGEIEARNRADAYTKIRKMGIRPYRVIGDDPYDWRPIVFWGVISVAVVVVIVALVNVFTMRDKLDGPKIVLTPEEGAAFRRRAVDAVYSAPSAYQYNVWRGVNARLQERGLESIPKPTGMVEEDAFAPPRFGD